MDALPVTEKDRCSISVRRRLASFAAGTVGVMHACGHDAHTAILMGVADILVALRDRLPGKVLLVFQPAEEGVPEGERGGAPLMLDEGLLEHREAGGRLRPARRLDAADRHHRRCGRAR